MRKGKKDGTWCRGIRWGKKVMCQYSGGEKFVQSGRPIGERRRVGSQKERKKRGEQDCGGVKRGKGQMDYKFDSTGNEKRWDTRKKGG